MHFEGYIQENCANMRNSKILDIHNELKSFGLEVLVSDPFADPRSCDGNAYGSHFVVDEVGQSKIDALILTTQNLYGKTCGRKL